MKYQNKKKIPKLQTRLKIAYISGLSINPFGKSEV